MKKIFLSALFLIFLTSFIQLNLYAEKNTPEDLKSILDEIDRTYRAKDSYAEISMTIINPNYERTISMKAWSKGMEKTLIRILDPKKDRGITTLRVGREMWNYFPKIDKVMKIPPSMMMGSWMGSDFTNDDLVKESTFLDDYDGELYTPENPDKDLLYVKLTPKEKAATVWGKILIKARKEDYLPVEEEYFDENGQKMRLMNFRNIKMLGGRKLPTIMEVIPLNKKGNKTIIEYKEAKFNQGIKDSMFSLRSLQKRI